MIAKKFPAIMEEKGLGGVFAWGLGEDADGFTHLRALNAEVKGFAKRYRGEGSDSVSTHWPSSSLKDEL